MMLSELERQEIFSAADAIGISQKEIHIEEFPDKPSDPALWIPHLGKIIMTIRSVTKTYQCTGGRVSPFRHDICQDIERGLFGR